MANPRLKYALEGVGCTDFTLKSDGSTIVYDKTKANGSASVGLAVTLSAAFTAALAADGDAIIGRLEQVESDGTCRIRKGFVELPGGASASLTLGKKIVGALGAVSAKGYIREVNTATAAELGKMNGQIIDASVTTAVIVKID